MCETIIKGFRCSIIVVVLCCDLSYMLIHWDIFHKICKKKSKQILELKLELWVKGVQRANAAVSPSYKILLSYKKCNSWFFLFVNYGTFLLSSAESICNQSQFRCVSAGWRINTHTLTKKNTHKNTEYENSMNAFLKLSKHISTKVCRHLCARSDCWLEAIAWNRYFCLGFFQPSNA